MLDNVGRVLVYDPDGKLLRQWWMPDYSVGKPEKIFQFRSGRLGVADTHYHRVVFFDPEGNVLSKHGSLGREPGQFIYPVAVVEDDDENYYVCEYGTNDRVQKFDKAGNFLLQFGSFGTEQGQFQRPSGIVWRDHKVYVVDAFNSRIQVRSLRRRRISGSSGRGRRIGGDALLIRMISPPTKRESYMSQNTVQDGSRSLIRRAAS